MRTGFEDILAECIDDILQGRQSVDSCLERYPEQAGELEPLLRIAESGSKALTMEAPATAREAGWRQVLDSRKGRSASSGPARHSWSFPGFRILLRPVALATGLMVIAGSGTALAASRAQPDNLLYPVKLGMEEVRTAIALQSGDQAVVEIGHARARLDEVLRMVDEDKAEQVPALLDRYHGDMGSARTDIDEASLAGEDVTLAEELYAAAEARYDQVLLDISDRLPEQVRAEIDDEIRDAREHETGAESGTDDSGNNAGPAGNAVPQGEAAPASESERDMEQEHGGYHDEGGEDGTEPGPGGGEGDTHDDGGNGEGGYQENGDSGGSGEDMVGTEEQAHEDMAAPDGSMDD